MKSHNIRIVETRNEAILKFESDQFLVQQDNYEFRNVDEAAISPLAQKLFYLPFVKTVYISQNFIAIERYNIVQWNEVQDEVKSIIEEGLNSEQALITEPTQKAERVPVSIYAESTPNPAVLKFVANIKLVIEAQEFKSIEHTVDGTLSRKLMQQPYVKELYVSENYIAVHKHNIATWDEVTLELRELVRESLQNKLEIGLSSYVAQESVKSTADSPAVQSNENIGEVEQQIINILDEYIKPAVASDGGNIKFSSFEEQSGRVEVILQGACSGCPSSTMTLKNGIETMLKEMIPGKIQQVVALNG